MRNSTTKRSEAAVYESECVNVVIMEVERIYNLKAGSIKANRLSFGDSNEFYRYLVFAGSLHYFKVSAQGIKRVIGLNSDFDVHRGVSRLKQWIEVPEINNELKKLSESLGKFSIDVRA